MAEQQTKYNPVYIDGEPWAVRLPTGGSDKHECENEWDDVLNRLGRKANSLHQNAMYSWCQDAPSGHPEYRIYRGASRINRIWNHDEPTRRHALLGFRPIFIPLNATTLLPDSSRIARMQDGTQLNMGTLYSDGNALNNPVNPTSRGDIPDYLPGAALRIGNTHKSPYKQIRVIKCGDILIADRNLLKNISWDDLNRQHLVFGTKQGYIQTEQVQGECILRYTDPEFSVNVEFSQHHVSFDDPSNHYDNAFSFAGADYSHQMAVFRNLCSQSRANCLDFKLSAKTAISSEILYFARLRYENHLISMTVAPEYRRLPEIYANNIPADNPEQLQHVLNLVYGGFLASEIDCLGQDNEQREKTTPVQLYRRAAKYLFRPNGSERFVSELLNGPQPL